MPWSGGDRDGSVTKQAPTKGAVADEVEVLLPQDAILQRLEHLLRTRRQIVFPGGESRGPEILKALLFGAGGEFVEVDRRVDILEVFVKEVPIRVGLPLGLFLFEECFVEPTLFGSQLGQDMQKRPRLFHPPLGVGDLADMECHHLPDHCPGMPSGVGVVAHIRDALRGEMPRADFQDAVGDIRRNPRVDPMADDVIELTELRADL